MEKVKELDIIREHVPRLLEMIRSLKHDVTHTFEEHLKTSSDNPEIKSNLADKIHFLSNNATTVMSLLNKSILQNMCAVHSDSIGQVLGERIFANPNKTD
jgi:hypothetical protein